MDQAADALLKASRLNVPTNGMSEFEIDGSSSLSEIEEKGTGEAEEDEEEDNEGVEDKEDVLVSDELSNVSDGENDSDVEIDHLEQSNQSCPHQDVILSSIQNFVLDFNRDKQGSHFKTHGQKSGEEEETLSSEEVIVDDYPDSTKSSVQNEVDIENLSTLKSPNDYTNEGNKNTPTINSDNRKRKRSIMGGTILDDICEPRSKRTGSVLTPSGDYPIEDEFNNDEDFSNHTIENISADEGGGLQDDDSAEDTEELNEIPQLNSETPNTAVSSRKRGRKKKRLNDLQVLNHNDDTENIMDHNGTNHLTNLKVVGADSQGNEDEEETEIALRNDEAIEKKRVALDRLGDIERQFSTFRDRLYEERLKQLNYEDKMLRQSQPSHPEYLAMLRCVDARRDEKLRRADRLREYEFQCLKRVAVAKRSQILVQYQQEIRDVREKKLEQLGEQWYKIQHDRRSYAGICPEFSLKFPKKRSQQISNHIAYSNEVSVLSGVAKYVGFPAAPIMAPASAAELEEDLDKIGSSKQISQAIAPMHELAALRAVSSSSKSRPAEEQFIELNPWANPQHPLHAHLIQKQASSSQIPRTSPFSQAQAPPRSHTQIHGGPNHGVFTNPTSIQQIITTKGRVSPQNTLGNTGLPHKIAPSPLGSRQTSLSPHQNRTPANIPEQTHHLPNTQIMHNIKGTTLSPVTGVNIDYLRESRLSTLR